MKCVVKDSFDVVFKSLNKAFGNIHSERVGNVGIILGE
jgi:hypothetical protein